MEKGDTVKRVNTNPEQHFTPAACSLFWSHSVKTLENGVGRPSIRTDIETIQKRYYVKLVSSVWADRT